MNRTKTLVIALWAMFVGQIASAQKGNEDQIVKDANAYFEAGAYLKAFPLYSQLVSLYPNHAEYAFKFGACAIYGDADKTKAVRYLNSAINKSVNDPEVYYFLGRAYHLNYQFKDAITAYENYVRYAGEKAPRKTDALRQIETCIYGANLLSNIKDITVLSKTETDKVNFFRYFNLEAIGGKILTLPDALKTKEDLKSSTPGVIHYPGNGTTIYFSSYGKSGSTGKDIYKAQVLADGTFSEPEKIKGGVNTKYDEDFCFMHSDGKTLYFASKGHNSMGGYDIFKSVYDPMVSEFGPAVNLDFAINTPDDDIFYIADSLNQRAYFASGRSSDLDHINVYSVLVETTPLQVVYLKGQFVSEIDPEQHKAGIKILESNTSRSVCDGSSNSDNGEYIVYVPKSGSYTFKVVTENSPTIHEVSVKIPAFDKPVALRQEMRLINEGGKERILINNYFESPLDEDLSVLAAEMLRKKSVLDVNTTSGEMVSLTKSDVKKEDELRTFDQNMDNTAIAAGFEAGVTAAVVMEDMKKEYAVIQRFVNESDTKRNNSLAFARKKQNEAAAIVEQAEFLKKQLGPDISSDEDINQLKQVVALTAQAAKLHQEAQAAFNTAQSISAFKESEAKRGEALQTSFASIQQSQQYGNYDASVAALSAEKDRRTAMRDGVGGAPYDQMMSKVRSLENERARQETKLTALRDEEKTKARNVRRIQENLNDPQLSKSDKEVLQSDLAMAESTLAKVRKELATQQELFNKSESGIRMAYAEAEFFQLVDRDSDAGLDPSDMIKLSPEERDMLGMSIAAIDTRVAQLEITDPDMLTKLGMTVETAPLAEQKNNSNDTTGERPQSVINENTAQNTASADSPAADEINAPAAAVSAQMESRMAFIEANPTLASARPMVIRQSISETRESIAALELKSKDGTITPAQRSQLDNLKSYELKLTQDLMTAQNDSPEVSSEDVRASFGEVAPGYENELMAIENEDGTEIDRTLNRMAYKRGLIEKLEQQQIANAQTLTTLNFEENPTEAQTQMAKLALKDAQLLAAITSLQADANRVSALKAAFELENKAIIESDDLYANKLQDQMVLSDQYMKALIEFENAQQSALASANEMEKQSIEAELAAIEDQRLMVEAKQMSYRHDLELTASASEPATSEVTAATANENTVDELNPLAVDAQNEAALTVDNVEAQSTQNVQSAITTAAETNTVVINPDAPADVAQTDNTETADTKAGETPATATTAATINTVQNVEETTIATVASADVAASESQTAKSNTIAPVEPSVEQDAKEIKKMFEQKEEVKSIFAYESAAFADLAAKHPQISARLNNMDKIETINDEIVLVEAEMEATKNESALKKLDYKAEQLYLKRSLLEIENSNVVSDLTLEEYNNELSVSNELIGTNQDKLNERVVVRDEVARLKRESDMNMQAAEKLREQARPIYDDIERADYYRQAFALEALAIDQQRQIQSICKNLEMLNQYNEADLAILKTGTVPASQKKNEIPAADEAAASTQEPNLNAAYENNNAEVVAANSASSATTETQNAAANTTDRSTETTVATDFARVEASMPLETTSVKQVEESTPVTPANMADATPPVTKDAAAAEERIYITRPENADPVKTALLTDEVVVVKSPEEVDGQKYNDGQATTLETVKVVAPAEAEPQPVAAVIPAASEGKAKASANAADYYYSMPAEVVADLFARTPRGVYSDTRPIPIDMEMPKGVYYKVQIGAFRNDIPQNLYDQFAPISGERLNSGITRYTAGFFVQFDNAKQVKQEIRAMGYSDAFIVAYRDGKRIPLYEAAAITDGPELAASIKEAFDKAAVGSKAQNADQPAQNTATTNTGSTATSSPNNAAGQTEQNSQGAVQKTNVTASESAMANLNTTQNSNEPKLNIDAEVAAEIANKPATRSVEEIEAAAALPKNTEYYNSAQTNAAKAQQVEAVQGLFFTIQVGVYSRPVAAAQLQNVNPLNSELTETNKIRYTSGQFNNMADAVNKRDDIRKMGIVDAFITAYYNGKRITLSEADLLLKEKGAAILAK